MNILKGSLQITAWMCTHVQSLIHVLYSQCISSPLGRQCYYLQFLDEQAEAQIGKISLPPNTISLAFNRTWILDDKNSCSLYYIRYFHISWLHSAFPLFLVLIAKWIIRQEEPCWIRPKISASCFSLLLATCLWKIHKQSTFPLTGIEWHTDSVQRDALCFIYHG